MSAQKTKKSRWERFKEFCSDNADALVIIGTSVGYAISVGLLAKANIKQAIALNRYDASVVQYNKDLDAMKNAGRENTELRLENANLKSKLEMLENTKEEA